MSDLKFEFVECDACQAKIGSPMLCAGCLHNRQVIYELRKQLDGKVDEMLFGRERNTPNYITFYTSEGHALRETMVSSLHHMDKRLHRKCERMAKKLGAASYGMFKHWVGFDVQNDDERWI